MIEINNLTDFPINKKSFSQVAKKVLSGENKKIKTLSLAFVPTAEMQKLNKRFRNKSRPTDVLSFEEINEIVICPEMVKKRGEDVFGVFVHGILHLCGYDHEKSIKDSKIMEEKEKLYLSKL